MFTLIAIIIIHSSPLNELAEKISPLRNQGEFSLKGERTIVVQEIYFQGNRGIPTEELEALTHPYLHQPLSETDLQEIERKIKEFYRSKGYPSAKVEIPGKQKRGVLTIHIEEGKKRANLSLRK